MPRPTTRAALLDAAEQGYRRLITQVEGLPPDRRSAPGVNGPWAVKDVLAHLSAWHTMLIGWYDEGQQGGKPAIPAPGFTWKTTPALNERIYQQHCAEDEAVIRAALETSHRRVMALIESLSEEDLFTPRRYHWTGSTTLGSYFVSATSSHYDWAHKLIRAWLRTEARLG